MGLKENGRKGVQSVGFPEIFQSVERYVAFVPLGLPSLLNPENLLRDAENAAWKGTSIVVFVDAPAESKPTIIIQPRERENDVGVANLTLMYSLL